MSFYPTSEPPMIRDRARVGAFSPGEVVSHAGERAIVVSFSRSRGVRLRAFERRGTWYAEPEEVEPLY